MADQNSMQMNLGLMPGVGPQGMNVTPSPAQAAMMLSKQALDNLVSANQQMQQSMQFMQANPSISAIARQVQTQISNIQSAVTVIPPSGATGQFAPPQLGSMGPGISPIPQMPLMQTPFTPRPPAPMFQTAWEQEQQQRDMRADRLYSFAMQAPPLAGQGMAYGAAALAGARLGGRFGPMGGVLGAAGGMMAAGMSGVAQGMGQMASLPFQPVQQAHEMGAAIQRTTPNWVMGGAQPGLGRNQSIQMAQQVSQLAAEPGFQKQTGGMFNSQDLMQIMGRAGQAGLMDQSQDIQSIRQNLRTTAQTIKEFMELTNDPDVSNVIRTMGQLRDVGMTQMQMRGAAANLKMYSKAAGLSLGQMGEAGMAGVQAFGAAGLAPDTGYQYGMQAMSGARQLVASGAMSPRQLAMAGGVQGVAGTHMQAQASFLGMPSLAMAGAQFTPQAGWQMDSGAMQEMMTQGVGAKELMKRARTQMKEGYGRGGGEALAMWPLQQRAVSAQIAESMSPEETMLMRFRTAEATGREMGLTTTQGAFALGARRLFGEDTATQMMEQASSPGFWRMQREGLKRRRTELGQQQYAQTMANVPGVVERAGAAIEQATGISRTGGAVGRRLGRAGGAIGDFFGGVGDFFEDRRARERGGVVSRRDPRDTVRNRSQQIMQERNRPQMLEMMDRYGQEFRGAEGMYQDVDVSGTTYELLAESQGYGGATGAADVAVDVGMTALEWMPGMLPVTLGLMGVSAITGTDVSLTGLVKSGIKEVRGRLQMSQQEHKDVQEQIKRGERQQKKLLKIYDEGAVSSQKARGRLGKEMGLDDGSYETVMATASAEFSKILRDREVGAVAGFFGAEQDPVTMEDYKSALRTGLGRKYPPEKVKQIMDKMEREGSDVKAFADMKSRVGGDREQGVLAKAETQVRELSVRLSDAYADTRARGVEEMERATGSEIWGEGGWFTEGYEDFRDTVGELAGQTTGLEFAGMVALGAGGEKDEQLQALYKGKKGSMTGYGEFKRKVLARRKQLTQGEGGKDMLAALEAAREGGADLSKVAAFGSEIGQGRQTRARIARTLEEVGGISAGAVGGTALLDTDSIAALADQDSIDRMKEAGGAQGEVGKILEDLNTMKKDVASGKMKPEEANKRRSMYLGMLSEMGARTAEEEKGPAATGPEAERLKKAEEATIIAQTEFTEALKKFADPKGTFLKSFNTSVTQFGDAVRVFENKAEGE